MANRVFVHPEVEAALKQFVRVRLFIDNQDSPAERANGDYMVKKFGTNGIPLYAVIDADENIINTIGYTPDPKKFLSFLQGALQAAPATE